jgi:DNA-binding transcriptional LysR family regulator
MPDGSVVPDVSERHLSERHPAVRSGTRGGVQQSLAVAATTPDFTRANIDLNLLIVFDAVMQTRNLTRAGRRLGLSQPATSHALARLRGMLHDELFVRTPEGMQPTPRAQQMAGPVREALRTLSATLEPDAFDPSRSTRQFTLAMNNYGARAVAPTLLRRVAATAPGVTLDIRPLGGADVLDLLDDDGVDLALAVLTDGGERFKCTRAMQDDYVAVLDRGHSAAAEPLLSIERFASIPHVMISSSDDDTAFVDEALEQRGFVRRIAARVPFLAIVLVLVGSDLLVVMPRRVAKDLSVICPVVVKELPFPSPRISLSMIWHRRVDNQPAHRWLRDMVRASAAGR